ncbi:transmembrane protein, putative [Medicago truncatula]|uniref:Transmembrane protein, putative n=1 Tax=Medicago truncatula TaxID=3880 RepID=A0A072USA1_MEDTR|nr:transmembrane protein, putative [Medicago truncatula]
MDSPPSSIVVLLIALAMATCCFATHRFKAPAHVVLPDEMVLSGPPSPYSSDSEAAYLFVLYSLNGCFFFYQPFHHRLLLQYVELESLSTSSSSIATCFFCFC